MRVIIAATAKSQLTRTKKKPTLSNISTTPPASIDSDEPNLPIAPPSPSGLSKVGWKDKGPGASAAERASIALPQAATQTTGCQFLDNSLPLGNSITNSAPARGRTGTPIHREIQARSSPPGSEPVRSSSA